MRNVAFIIGIVAFPLAAGEPLSPGIKVGERVPIHTEYRATGPRAGEKGILICTFAFQPVVVVYTRELTEPVIRLIKKVDAAIERQRVHPSPTYCDNLASYVVLICDSQKREAELKAIAEKEKIQHTILALIVDDKLQAKLGKDAETTVLLAYRARVKSGFAYRTGELSDKHIDRILAEVPKILPDKK